MVLLGDSREGAGDFRLSMSLSPRLLKQVSEGFVTNVPSFLWSSQKWPNKLLQGKVSVLLARLLLPGELVALASARWPADIVPLSGDWTQLGCLPPSDSYRPVVLGCGVRAHREGDRSSIPIAGRRDGDWVWLGKGAGLQESVAKSLTLLGKGEIEWCTGHHVPELAPAGSDGDWCPQWWEGVVPEPEQLGLTLWGAPWSPLNSC